jgi:Zn-dependent protease
LGFSFADIIQRAVLYLPVLLLSLTVHEFAHAWAARRLGDDTAERMGRLTLNPLAHADPLGTFLLPLIAPFGWAKPVPVNPARFRPGVDMGRGMMFTSLAGPFANVILAIVSTVILGLLYRLAPGFSNRFGGLAAFLQIAIQMNVVLAVFNLIPIPPLDGSRIVDAFLPTRLRPQWEAFARFSPFLLLALVFFGWRIIAVPVEAGIRVLERLLVAII